MAGKRGRPKKSIEHHKETGNYRPSRHGTGENPGFETVGNILPDPPAPLNTHGRKEWRRICRELQKDDMLAVIDLGLLAMACEYYGDFWELREYLVKENKNRKTDALGKYLNEKMAATATIYQAINKSFEIYSKTVAAFGISPVERSKIVKPEKPADKPLGIMGLVAK